MRAIPGEALRVSRSITIPPDELEWRFSGSGGPGGQHANTSNTRVELLFDISRSAHLGPRQRERLLERLGPTCRVVATDERSQLRNREVALARLAERLLAALVVEKTRRPTRPGKGAVTRRLESKRHLSDKKAARRRGPTDD
jgi:ribosome-associated protein